MGQADIFFILPLRIITIVAPVVEEQQRLRLRVQLLAKRDFILRILIPKILEKDLRDQGR